MVKKRRYRVDYKLDPRYVTGKTYTISGHYKTKANAEKAIKKTRRMDKEGRIDTLVGIKRYYKLRKMM